MHFKRCFEFAWKDLRKPMENVSQDNQVSGQELSFGPPEYTARVLTMYL